MQGCKQQVTDETEILCWCGKQHWEWFRAHSRNGDLINALHHNVGPHGPIDEGLGAPMGGLQQQIRGGVLCSQSCRHTHRHALVRPSRHLDESASHIMFRILQAKTVGGGKTGVWGGGTGDWGKGGCLQSQCCRLRLTHKLR